MEAPASRSDLVRERHAFMRYQTKYCTECDRLVDQFGFAIRKDGRERKPGETLGPDHLVDGEGYVLVGCEGYWFINPALLGLGAEHPNWSDWTEMIGMNDAELEQHDVETFGDWARGDSTGEEQGDDTGEEGS